MTVRPWSLAGEWYCWNTGRPTFNRRAPPLRCELPFTCVPPQAWSRSPLTAVLLTASPPMRSRSTAVTALSRPALGAAEPSATGSCATSELDSAAAMPLCVKSASVLNCFTSQFEYSMPCPSRPSRGLLTQCVPTSSAPPTKSGPSALATNASSSSAELYAGSRFGCPGWRFQRWARMALLLIMSFHGGSKNRTRPSRYGGWSASPSVSSTIHS
mmetsp:Transcript_27814/g.66241  ORF Transcript_27814/g.66241 Transcript_27814/m.66241 type:complete len:214 (+) Transcript_27814:527-1168(+)